MYLEERNQTRATRFLPTPAHVAFTAHPTPGTQWHPATLGHCASPNGEHAVATVGALVAWGAAEGGAVTGAEVKAKHPVCDEESVFDEAMN